MPDSVEFHSIPADYYPFTVEFWEAGADRRGEPTRFHKITGPGVIEIEGLGDGTWTRVVFANGEVMIEPPPGEDARDF